MVSAHTETSADIIMIVIFATPLYHIPSLSITIIFSVSLHGFFYPKDIPNQSIVFVSSLLQITVILTEVWRAGLITNESHIRDIERKSIT